MRGRENAVANAGPGSTAVLLCADLLAAQGARRIVVKALLDCLQLSNRRFFVKDVGWQEEPNWELRGKIGLGLLPFLDGQPVTRSETVQLIASVNVGADGNSNLTTIGDDGLRDAAMKAVEKLGGNAQKVIGAMNQGTLVNATPKAQEVIAVVVAESITQPTQEAVEDAPLSASDLPE